MGWDPATREEDFEEVRDGARAADGVGPGRSPRDGRGGRAGVRRWVPVILVGGLAVLIVGAGVLGPKMPSVRDQGRDTATASPAASPSPREMALRAAPTPAATPIPRLRLAGTGPEDRFLLLGGRWIDIVTGTVDGKTGCEREQPLVLAGGRIVCIAQQVVRPQGSTRATYELSAVTLGRSRAAPSEPWASPPPGVADGVRPAVPLTTLAGRRDLAFGDPVAIALAPGAEPDILFLAWAVLGDAGYRIGLDRYRVGDAAAVATGSREVFALPLEDDRGPTSLADLAVSVSPDGSAALVGVTVTGTQPTAGERRLAVLRMNAGAVSGSAIGRPVALPLEVTSNAAATVDVARDGETACGGALGEGWATDATLFLVCPGAAELRVVDVRDGSGGGPPVGAVIATVHLGIAESNTVTAPLAGYGVAVDAARSVMYRWSPATATLWRVDFTADGDPRVATLELWPRYFRSLAAGPDADAGTSTGPRPILALDADHGRLYALWQLPDGSGKVVIHLIDVASWKHFASFWVADGSTRAIALSPDGRLLYASTKPRPVGSPALAVGVAVLDAFTGVELAYAGRLRVGAGGPLHAVVVR